MVILKLKQISIYLSIYIYGEREKLSVQAQNSAD